MSEHDKERITREEAEKLLNDVLKALSGERDFDSIDMASVKLQKFKDKWFSGFTYSPRSWVLCRFVPPKDEPIFLVYRGYKSAGNHEFHVNESTCPVNICRGAETLIVGDDKDPHGVMEYICEMDAPDIQGKTGFEINEIEEKAMKELFKMAIPEDAKETEFLRILAGENNE